MSIKRQANLLGQQRLDAPHLRGIESSIAYDFDMLAGMVISGNSPQIVKGFSLSTTSTTGILASQLKIVPAGSIVLHPTASEAGTVFAVELDQPEDTLNSANENVVGAFTANSINYIGLELIREVDNDTVDQVTFLDASTLSETSQTVPLARTMKYRIYISTIPFASTPHLAPIAKITTSSTNTVTLIEDARQLLFRLGSGGTTPNSQNSYLWPLGRRENTTGDVFSGGDKSLDSFKTWMDAVMTRLWELGGGEYWYRPTSYINVKLGLGDFSALSGSPTDNFEWDLGTDTLKWAGVNLVFTNSQATYNEIEDELTGIIILDGQCLYVDLDRSADRDRGVDGLEAQVTEMATLGTPEIPGSRVVIAWRHGDEVFIRDRPFDAGRVYPIATNTGAGISQLAYTAHTVSSAPIIFPLDQTTHGLKVGTGSYPIPSGQLAVQVEGASAGTAHAMQATSNTTGYAILGIQSGSNTMAAIAGEGKNETAASTDGGVGVLGTGGDADGASSIAGHGVFGQGGVASDSSSYGGHGVYGQGGAGGATAKEGYGVYGVAGYTSGVRGELTAAFPSSENPGAVVGIVSGGSVTVPGVLGIGVSDNDDDIGGGIGVIGQGGHQNDSLNASTDPAGPGVQGFGGDVTGGFGTADPGNGVEGYGGDLSYGSGAGGTGLYGIGGTGTSGGKGAETIGASFSSGGALPGPGIAATGGSATGAATNVGGIGVNALGGSSAASTGGRGVSSTGGASSVAGGGSGVYSTGGAGATDGGTGVYGQGGTGTNNGGVGVYGVGGTSAGTYGPGVVGSSSSTAVPAIRALGSDIEVPSTRNYIYSTAVTRTKYVGAFEFVKDTTSSGVEAHSTLGGNPISVNNSSTTDPLSLWANVHLPPGAIIQNVWIFAINTDTGGQSFSSTMSHYTVTSSPPTLGTPSVLSVLSGSVNHDGSPDGQWLEPDNSYTNTTVPDSGWCKISVTIPAKPAVPGTDTLGIAAIRIEYTHTAVKPDM